MLRDEAIANVLHGVVGAAGEMAALCIGIGEDVIRTTIKAATMYKTNSTPASTTAVQDLLVV